jgi:hypothetical protein
MSENYRCPNCNNILPLRNKFLHDLRCPGLNHSNSNRNNERSHLNSNNNNRNQRNNYPRFNNRNNSNNIIATNTFSRPNPDGT